MCMCIYMYVCISLSLSPYIYIHICIKFNLSKKFRETKFQSISQNNQMSVL